MRTFLIIVLILAVVIGAIALYLVMTIPGETKPLRVPLDAAQRAMLARVPASADAFALIPTAGLLHRKLTANPVTRDAVERWTAQQPIPKPWLLGGADAVVWRIGKKTSYAIRLDTFRALLVRIFMMWSSDVEARWDGKMFVINGGGGTPIAAATLDEVLRLGNGLPVGDVLVVQRDRARGMFPPIGRPSVSMVQVSPAEILLTSRSANNEALASKPVQPRHPRGALLSAGFAQPPRLLDDAERLLGTDVSALVDDGGSIALYDSDAGTLLPRPKGVITVPADDAARSAMEQVIRVAELVGETRDTGREILVSFDRTSMPLYLKDAFVPATWPANRWALRIDAARITPILERLGDNRGLRFVAPRLHRAARDLRRWTEALRQAESIEAADSVSGGIEELRVRIASK